MALAVALLIVAGLSIGAVFQDRFVADLWLTRTFQEVTATPWGHTMEGATIIGQNAVLIAIAVSVLLWLLWSRQRAEATVLLAALLSLGVNPLLKIVVNRPRPSDELVTVWRDFGGLGFPSGHAFSAIVLFGLLYYLAPRAVPWEGPAALIRASSLTLILLIGVSRVYLGAHWPSDVLGGFLYGIIVLALLIGFHEWISGTQGRRSEARV